jgi:sugar phosphate isomerase/epimerase
MRISFSTGTYYHLPLTYSLRLASTLGFDGVEWVVHPAYLLQGLDPVRRAFTSSGVRPLSIHPPFYSLPGWPRQPPRAMARLGALARRLGAELVVVHTAAFTTYESQQEDREDRYVKALERGQLAGGPHVVIGVETAQFNKRPNKHYTLDDLTELVAFCKQHECGITLDTCHSGANGEDLLASYEAVRPLLRNVHLSDVQWRGGRPCTHRLPGEGHLPLDRLLQRMAADSYDGLVTLEIHPLKAGPFSRDEAARRLGQALDFIRSNTAGYRHQRAKESAEPLRSVEE